MKLGDHELMYLKVLIEFKPIRAQSCFKIIKTMFSFLQYIQCLY